MMGGEGGENKSDQKQSDKKMEDTQNKDNESDEKVEIKMIKNGSNKK